MPEQPKSRLDRELEEILTKKAKERPNKPIQFSSHPRAPKTNGQKALSDGRQMASEIWKMLTRNPLVMALVFAIAARLVSDFSQLLALILSAVAVGGLWWPGIKRLSASKESEEADVKYWRGRPYTTEIKDVISRHPVDSIKRYFDRRR